MIILLSRTTCTGSALSAVLSLLLLPQGADAGFITSAIPGADPVPGVRRSVNASRSSVRRWKTDSAAGSSRHELQRIHEESTRADNAKRKRKPKRANAEGAEGGSSSSTIPGFLVSDLTDDSLTAGMGAGGTFSGIQTLPSNLDSALLAEGVPAAVITTRVGLSAATGGAGPQPGFLSDSAAHDGGQHPGSMGLQPGEADSAGAGFMLPGDQSSLPDFDQALTSDAGSLATELAAGAGLGAAADESELLLGLLSDSAADDGGPLLGALGLQPGPDGAGALLPPGIQLPPGFQPLWPDGAAVFPPEPGFTRAPAFGAGVPGDTTVLQNPEPASLLLFGLGGGVLAWASYRRRTNSAPARG